MIRFPLTFLLTCFVFFSHFSSPFALTIGVPGSKPTIQAGIDAASPGDTVLVQPGRYFENIDFKGKNIVVGSLFLSTKDSSYILNTIIDAQGKDTVVAFKNGETEKAELCGFTITDGQSRSNVEVGGNIGGGIYCKNASPYLHHLIIEGNNSALQGGGMYLEKSNSVIEYCVIRNNKAILQGNGLNIVQSNNQIKNCIINDNNGHISGIHCNKSKVLFFRVLLLKNLTSYALETSNSEINIINCTITNNYSDTFIIFNSDVNIINSIFWNNSPQIFIDDTNLPISHVTIAFSDIKNGKDSVKIWTGNALFNWREGNIINDPFFLNDNSYSLSSSSLCIDTGTPYYQVGDSTIINLDTNEYYGNAPDIGAYESNYTHTGISSENTLRMELVVFPNPFNATISIEFKLPIKSKVNLSVFSITGQKVYELVSNILPAGKHIYRWKGENMKGMKVSSGVYIVRFNGEIFFQTKRVIFLK